MASSARIFFAGIGTTFVIIAAGFGGGLLFAKTALHDSPVQNRASSHQIEPIRVILPTTAEAALAPQPIAVPVPMVLAPEIKVAPKQIEKVDTKRIEAEESARKKRYAERIARRNAVARQQMETRQQVARVSQPGVLAFNGDDTRAGGFFGN